MKKTAFCLLVICLLCCCAYAQTNQYSVVFNLPVKEKPDNTQYDIFTFDQFGNKKNLTNNPDIAWVYSAYQDKIFFISDRDTCYRCFFLYRMDDNGQNVKKISDLQLEDSWMGHRFNGKEWVVTGRKGNSRMQLYIVNAETGQYKQITSDTAALHRDPVFSPDGSKIAFAYKKNRRDRNPPEEVYIMNNDGSGMKQLTHYPPNDKSGDKFGYRAGALRWHPTENFISYISMQNGHHSIFAVDPEGTKQWKITGGYVYEGWHDWSADGRWLVFDQSDVKEEKYNLVLMNWQTKDVKILNREPFSSPPCPVFVKKTNQ